jgi:hypothetical protein
MSAEKRNKVTGYQYLSKDGVVDITTVIAQDPDGDLISTKPQFSDEGELQYQIGSVRSDDEGEKTDDK